MVFETLLFTIILLPLFFVLACAGCFLLLVLWVVLPKNKFQKVIAWTKELKRKLKDDNI